MNHYFNKRSIIKKYRKTIWCKFAKAIRDYELIKDNDKIMVCISGGKDSFLLAKCVEELQKHSKIPFRAEYVCMNPGYNEKNEKRILENAKILNIDLKMFHSNIFDVVDETATGSPCYLCARMRRGCLYKEAQRLGCNKIALGHHFNDVIETTLLSMFYGAEFKTMMPKLHSENFEGLELIRPLYLVKEDDIISWKNSNELVFLNCACHFTEKVSTKEEESKRKEIKELIKKLKTVNDRVDSNIFTSATNVNLDTIIGYKKNKKYYSFLDEYDEKK